MYGGVQSAIGQDTDYIHCGHLAAIFGFVSGGVQANTGRNSPRVFEANSEPVSQITPLFISLCRGPKGLRYSGVARKMFRRRWLSRYKDYVAGWMSEDLPYDFLQGRKVFLFSKS